MVETNTNQLLGEVRSYDTLTKINVNVHSYS